jgi:hypothetical protein
VYYFHLRGDDDDDGGANGVSWSAPAELISYSLCKKLKLLL